MTDTTPQAKTKTTIEMSGPGKITFADLLDFVDSISNSGMPRTEVEVDVTQERSYDSEAREMRDDEWSMKATVETPR
jgi:hypothetical protein